MHDNRYMIIHVSTDIPEKCSSKNRHETEGDTSVVHVRICMSVRYPACHHDVVPDRDIAVYARQVQNLVNQGGASKFSSGLDGLS